VLSGIASAFGFRSSLSLTLFAILGAAGFIVIMLMFNIPVYMVIWNTALAGAAITVSGVMLMFGQIDRDDLSAGSAVAAINDSWFWILAWAIVSAIGIMRQLTLRERVRLPENRWTPSTQGAVR